MSTDDGKKHLILPLTLFTQDMGAPDKIGEGMKVLTYITHADGVHSGVIHIGPTWRHSMHATIPLASAECPNSGIRPRDLLFAALTGLYVDDPTDPGIPALANLIKQIGAEEEQAEIYQQLEVITQCFSE